MLKNYYIIFEMEVDELSLTKILLASLFEILVKSDACQDIYLTYCKLTHCLLLKETDPVIQ